ncbi:hypothetical protein [Alloscardovia criceti]|uniref:hypothetical protein n=1 Tax=Alloscardovia criceti TaxID=356828 RepID=UPI0003718908|nr:hypothetical protein [Alloscardovia criceti]
MSTKASQNRFTIGAAFERTWWVSAIVDGLMLVLSLCAGYFYAQWTGVISALMAWILALLFSETNAVITVILDKIGLTSSTYTMGMMQLWGVKIALVIVIGALMLAFVPYNLGMFCFTLVFTVIVCTMKNVIISARARIL